MKKIFPFITSLTFSCFATQSFGLTAVCNEKVEDRTPQIVYVKIAEPYMTQAVVTYPNPGYKPFSYTLPCYQNFETNALECTILYSGDGLPSFKFILNANGNMTYETRTHMGYDNVLSSYYSCKKAEE